MGSSNSAQKRSPKRIIEDGGAQNLSDFLELLHDAVIVRDAKGVILYWNRGAERMYGWTTAEAKGHASHEFLQTGVSRVV